VAVEVVIRGGREQQRSGGRNGGGVAVVEVAARPIQRAVDGGVADEVGVAAEHEIQRGEQAAGGERAAVEQGLAGSAVEGAGVDGAAGIQREDTIEDSDGTRIIKGDEYTRGAAAGFAIDAGRGVVKGPDVAREVVVEIGTGGVIPRAGVDDRTTPAAADAAADPVDGAIVGDGRGEEVVIGARVDGQVSAGRNGAGREERGRDVGARVQISAGPDVRVRAEEELG